MKQILIRCAALLLIPVLVLVTASCSSSTEVTAAAQEHLQDLVQTFVNDLDGEILGLRENPKLNQNPDIVINMQNETLNPDALRRFYAQVSGGSDAQVTILFSNTGFVVTRIIFEGDTGYYLRYQYDAKATGPHEVSSQLLDRVEMTEDTGLNKIELKLYNGKKEIASFNLRHLVSYKADDSQDSPEDSGT